MAVSDKVFAGSIRNLRSVHGAADLRTLCARSRRTVGQNKTGNVLETAAGTGVLTRAMASILRRRTRLVATDLNQPMLDRARRDNPATAGSRGGRPTRWRCRSPSKALTRWHASSARCSSGQGFGLPGAHRVLRPGGHFFSMCGDRSRIMNSRIWSRSAGRAVSARPAALHGAHATVITIRNASGRARCQASPPSRSTRRAPQQRRLAARSAIAYCQGTPLRNEIEARDASSLETATRQATEALTRRFGAGAIEGRIQALVITASRS